MLAERTRGVLKASKDAGRWANGASGVSDSCVLGFLCIRPGVSVLSIPAWQLSYKKGVSGGEGLTQGSPDSVASPVLPVSRKEDMEDSPKEAVPRGSSPPFRHRCRAQRLRRPCQP